MPRLTPKNIQSPKWKTETLSLVEGDMQAITDALNSIEHPYRSMGAFFRDSINKNLKSLGIDFQVRHSIMEDR